MNDTACGKILEGTSETVLFTPSTRFGGGRHPEGSGPRLCVQDGRQRGFETWEELREQQGGVNMAEGGIQSGCRGCEITQRDRSEGLCGDVKVGD